MIICKFSAQHFMNIWRKLHSLSRLSGPSGHGVDQRVVSRANRMLSISSGQVLRLLFHHSSQRILHILTEVLYKLITGRIAERGLNNSRHVKRLRPLVTLSGVGWFYLWKFLSVSSRWRRISSAHSVDGAPEILSLTLFRSCLSRDCNSSSSSADSSDISETGKKRVDFLGLTCANKRVMMDPWGSGKTVCVWACSLSWLCKTVKDETHRSIRMLFSFYISLSIFSKGE